jgi:hypothetical protein
MLVALLGASWAPATATFLRERDGAEQAQRAAPDTAQAATSPRVAAAVPPPLPGQTATEPVEEPDDPVENEPPPPPPPPRDGPTSLGDLDEVETQRPAVRVDGLGDDATDVLETVRALDTVEAATVVSRALGELPGPDGEPIEVQVAAVDPVELRTLVPQITSDEIAVWERLAEGDLLVDVESVERLGVELSDEVSLSEHDPRRVGVIAATGRPPVADVVVSIDTGRSYGMPEPNALLAATSDGHAPSEVAVALEEQLGGRATALIDDPARGGPVNVDAGVWAAVAQCESSGDWHINTGNGYYGGLQFLPESWWWVGGQGMPHEASPEEQIYRAEILLSLQGWEAWPACSKALGLR